MADVPETVENNTKVISEVEMQKLLLEVEEMRSKSKWDRAVGRFIPLISALVAVAGFWLALSQFSTQQADKENQRQDRVAEMEREQIQREKDREDREKQRYDAETQRQLEREEKLIAKEKDEKRLQQEKVENESARQAQEERRQIELDAEFKKSVQTREDEFKKPLWQKQLDLYFDASQAVSTMSTTSDQSDRRKAEDKFWELFYGRLVLVEDEKVEKAMLDIRKYLLACKQHPTECADYELKNLSLALASSCRESLGQTWRVALKDLKGKYNSSQ